MAGTVRKIPVHRGGGSTGGSGPRTVSRPGVTGSTGNPEDNFISPFQPPPGFDDLEGDAVGDGWTQIEVGGQVWRVKRPGPRSLHVLTMATSDHQPDKVIRSSAIRDFVAQHLHPDDYMRALMDMVDPDTGMDKDVFYDILRGIATVGTARPFRPS